VNETHGAFTRESCSLLVRCLQKRKDAADATQETFGPRLSKPRECSTRTKNPDVAAMRCDEFGKDRYRHRTGIRKFRWTPRMKRRRKFPRTVPGTKAHTNRIVAGAQSGWKPSSKAVTELPKRTARRSSFANTRNFRTAEIGSDFGLHAQGSRNSEFTGAKPVVVTKLGWMFEHT